MPRGGVFAVIVVYRMQPMASPSLRTLLAAAATVPALRMRLLVADNTPGGQMVEALPAEVEYRAYLDNPGLARPYNDALAMAEREGYAWLLTLDQDTTLPMSFLTDMLAVARQYDDVAAVAPRILDGGRLVSPFRYVGGFLPWMLPAGTSGICGPHTSALNSASLLRVEAVRAIGGYDEQFPLHNSDTRLYQRIDEAGMQVAVAGDIVVPHELSILDRQGRMSAERYRHMLRDECDFWDRHMGPAGRAERLLRLLLRWCKGLVGGEDAAFLAVTLKEILRRLLTTRTTRLLRRS